MAQHVFGMKMIVLVGVDTQTQLVVKSVMTGMPATLRTIPLGPSTVAELAELRPDLIIFEVGENLDVLAAIEGLRQTAETSSIPVIVLASVPELVRGRIGRQVFTVLPLPVRPDDLRLAMQTALG